MVWLTLNLRDSSWAMGRFVGVDVEVEVESICRSRLRGTGKLNTGMEPCASRCTLRSAPLHLAPRSLLPPPWYKYRLVCGREPSARRERLSQKSTTRTNIFNLRLGESAAPRRSWRTATATVTEPLFSSTPFSPSPTHSAEPSCYLQISPPNSISRPLPAFRSPLPHSPTPIPRIP